MAQEVGFSLLELMAVILIIAIVSMITMPLLQRQIANREVEVIARRFSAHAQFARQQALFLGQPVHIVPKSGDQLDTRWVVKSGCIGKLGKAVNVGCIDKLWL